MEDIEMTNEILFSYLECNREIDYFSLFLTEEIYNEIVIDSERYFRDKFYDRNLDNQTITPNSYAYHYQKYGISIDHFKAYIAAILYMGLEPKEHINYYWTDDSFHSNNFLSKIMSRNFFFYLSALIHLEIQSEIYL